MRGPKAAVVIGGAFFVTMLGPTIPTPLYPIYQEVLGFDGLMVTIIFATYTLGIAGALILFGRLSDQIGRRTMLFPGLILAFASSLVFLLSDNVTGLFLGRILSGLSVGIFTGTATAALLDIAPTKSRRTYSLIAALVNMLGLGFGPILAGAVAEVSATPLTLPYLIHMVLVILALAGIAMISEPHPASVGTFRWEFQRLNLPAEVKGTFMRAATAGFAGFSTLGLFASVAPALLLHVIGIANHLVCGLVVFAQLAFSAVGQISSTRMKDRTAMLLGTAMLTAGVLLIGASILLASLPILLIGAAAAGAGQGMSFRASLSMLAERTPVHQRGEITSTFFLVLYVAQAVPVMGVGFAANVIGLAAAGEGFAVFIAITSGAAFFSLLSQTKANS
jgi:MFS family permease